MVHENFVSVARGNKNVWNRCNIDDCQNTSYNHKYNYTEHDYLILKNVKVYEGGTCAHFYYFLQGVC